MAEVAHSADLAGVTVSSQPQQVSLLFFTSICTARVMCATYNLGQAQVELLHSISSRPALYGMAEPYTLTLHNGAGPQHGPEQGELSDCTGRAPQCQRTVAALTVPHVQHWRINT